VLVFFLLFAVVLVVIIRVPICSRVNGYFSALIKSF